MNQPPKLADHLIAVPGDLFAMWKWVCVRSAGFPADTVLQLAASKKIMALIAQYNQLTQSASQQQIALLDYLKQVTPNLPKPQRKLWQKLYRYVKNNRIPTTITVNIPLLVSWIDTQQSLNNLKTKIEEQYAIEAQRINQALRTIFQRTDFQEAIIWQNRDVYKNCIQWLLKQPLTKANRRMRDCESRLASYGQRYCLKNETIGFFGPVGWGHILPSSAKIVVNYKAGPSLLKNRDLYFEQWGIDALADSLNHMPNIHLWLAPQRLPFFYLENRVVHLPIIRSWLRQKKLPPLVDDTILLTDLQYKLLQLCDGKRVAHDIAAIVLTDYEIETANKTNIYQEFRQLSDWGLLRWQLEIPQTLFPERTLRDYLERIPDLSLRQTTLTPLNELEQAYQQLTEARGNPEQLNQSINHLEQIFTKHTHQSATHSKGKYYAGRNLLYEECQRDINLTFGTGLTEKLGPPLSLILASVRWFTHQVADLYRHHFNKVYTQLAETLNNSTIDFYSFFEQVTPLLNDNHNSLLTTATHTLQNYWATILGISVDNADESIPVAPYQLDFSYQALSEPVETTFKSTHAGWQLARYCSPDVMIAGADLKAIQQGGCQLVLGELHLFNTLSRSLFVSQHPYPMELFEARQKDIPKPTVVPVPSKQWNTNRFATVLTAPHDVWLAYEKTASDKPLAQTITIGELLIEQTEQGLQVFTHDNRYRFDVIEFFGHTLSNQCMTFPTIVPPMAHRPRITIEGVVICRESWRFKPTDLSWTQAHARLDLLVNGGAWAKMHGIPRFVFVKTVDEPKPFFVDFESPLYLDMLARVVRRLANHETTPEIQFTELLPGFDQLWLTDATGHHYTSELRLVMLDMATW